MSHLGGSSGSSSAVSASAGGAGACAAFSLSRAERMAPTPAAHMAARAISAPVRPASVSTVMMPPASTTPASIAAIASCTGMRSSAPMMAPVHAPVPGAGTPTKSARARERDWPEGSAFSLLSARLSSGAATFLTASERSARRVGRMGSMLPATQMTNVVRGDRPSQLPTGTPPRSSTAGTMEMRRSTTQSGNPVRLKTRAIF
mmetsp:Transcript_25460/g.64515  ORF Transcript_25460/g.64515 Transcript_25460/m.64515 type:complete len:203 (-) Transcript_25460:20-628(-)